MRYISIVSVKMNTEVYSCKKQNVLPSFRWCRRRRRLFVLSYVNSRYIQNEFPNGFFILHCNCLEITTTSTFNNVLYKVYNICVCLLLLFALLFIGYCLELLVIFSFYFNVHNTLVGLCANDGMNDRIRLMFV